MSFWWPSVHSASETWENGYQLVIGGKFNLITLLSDKTRVIK